MVTNSRVFYTTREAAGAAGTRHSPRPLFSKGASFLHNSGASRREIADLYLKLAYLRFAHLKLSWLFESRIGNLLFRSYSQDGGFEMSAPIQLKAMPHERLHDGPESGFA